MQQVRASEQEIDRMAEMAFQAAFQEVVAFRAHGLSEEDETAVMARLQDRLRLDASARRYARF